MGLLRSARPLALIIACLWPCLPLHADFADTITVHFAKASYTIDETYGENQEALHRLDSIISTSSLQTLAINSSSSPDGTYWLNQSLCMKRLKALRDYLAVKYPHLVSKIVENEAHCQSWSELSADVKQHSLLGKDYKAMTLILTDRQMDEATKQKRLKQSLPPPTYAFMADSILPLGRSATCIFIKEIPPYRITSEELVPSPEQQADTCHTIPLPCVTEGIKPSCHKPSHWGVSTNLLHWAGLAHNFGLEYSINSQHSLGLSGSCAWFSHKSRHRVYRWMVGELTYHHYLREHHVPRGFFVGLYAQAGEFELMFSPRNRKGEFYAAGICSGYRWQVRDRLFMEAEAGWGYMYIDYRHALDIHGVLLRQGKVKRQCLPPTRLAVTLVYRFDKK